MTKRNLYIYLAFFILIYVQPGYATCQGATEPLATEIPMSLPRIYQRLQSFGCNNPNFCNEIVDAFLESCSPRGENYFDALKTSIQGTDLGTIKIYMSGLTGMFSYFSEEMHAKFKEISEKIDAKDLITAGALLNQLTPSYHRFVALLQNHRKLLPTIGRNENAG